MKRKGLINWRQFSRICFLFVIFSLSTSQAIVSTELLPADKTPLILQGFKDGLQKYNEENKDPDLKYFFFRYRANAEDALREILLGQLNGYNREQHLERMLNEFQKIQADVLSRGYEPSKNLYWAPPQQLHVSYGPRSVGPVARSGQDKVITHYSHSFEFEMALNYQPVNKPLQEHQVYPRVFLKGSVHLECKLEFDDCQMLGAEIDSAGLSWEQMPGHRGGNSSAGGTTTKSNSGKDIREAILSEKIVITDLKKPRPFGFEVIKKPEFQIPPKKK